MESLEIYANHLPQAKPEDMFINFKNGYILIGATILLFRVLLGLTGIKKLGVHNLTDAQTHTHLVIKHKINCSHVTSQQ